LSVFDIPNAERLEASFRKSFGDIRYMRRKIEHSEFIQLRASSFPICPRAYVIYRRLPVSKRPRREETFIAESSAWMGTALHQALQKWFGLEGQLHGNWVCVHCKKIRRHQTGMQICSSCGLEMVYHEYAIACTKDNPFSGHIDGILHTPDNYLIDFKGSNLEKIREYKADNKPKESHYLQVNAYANYVNDHLADFGLTEELKKIIIIYVDRGAPWKTWLPLQVPISRRVYKEVLGRIRLAQECLTTGRIPRGLCVDPADSYAKYCPWRTVCFSPAIDGILSRDVEIEGKHQEVSEHELLLLASFLKSH
jgi:ribosomal protein L37AE/L43A